MRKIVYGLIISVCLGANLYADNSKNILLYTDIFEVGKDTFYLGCGVVIKPSKEESSGYKSVESRMWLVGNEKEVVEESKVQITSCDSLNESLKFNKNPKFKKRIYEPKALEILYNHK